VARVLGALRLSKASKESLSVEDQKLVIQRWVDAYGHEVVGWTEDDEGVKGDLAPWKRPGLGRWLPSTIGMEDPSKVEVERSRDASRMNEWDILCAAKLDRFSRSVIHAYQFARWAIDNGKSFVTVDNGFDLGTEQGKQFYGMLAMFAEAEHDSIKARARASHRRLMAAGRWRGGQVPYGYLQVPDPDGKGWHLVPDEDGEDTAGRVREISDRIIAGESVNSVCRWLNAERIPTSMDVQRIRANKEPEGYYWRPGNLLQILRSHSLLGQASTLVEVKREDGKPVRRTKPIRGADGLPVQRAEPILTRERWEELQRAIDVRSDHRGRGAVRTDRRLLLRVAFCLCGAPLYNKINGHGTLYYTCSTRNTTGRVCDISRASIRGEDAEREVTHAFLATVGDIEIVRREWVPGSDHAEQIAELDRALDELQADRQAGIYSTPSMAVRFRTQFKKLGERREHLASLPSTPGHYRDVPTGETYRERWARLSSNAERNAELRAAGMQAILHPNRLPPLSIVEGGPFEGRDYFRQHYGRLEIRIPARIKYAVREHAVGPVSV
jgi:site-specific DNA recombinase